MSIPYHGTSESFQAEASGVQRFLASLSPHTSSSLAHSAHWIYISPLKLPLNLELNKAVLKLALTPFPSAQRGLPSPLFKGWDKPVAPRPPEAKKGEWNAILFFSSYFLHSPVWWHSHSGGLLSSGRGKREEGSRTRGPAGPEDVNSNGRTRKGKMQTQNHWSHDSALVLASNTCCVVLSQHPSLSVRNYSLPMKRRGSTDLCLVNTSPRISITACSIQFSCKLLNLYTRANLLENPTKLEKKHLTLLCTRLQGTKPLSSPSYHSKLKSWLVKFCFLRVMELDTPKWLTSRWGWRHSLQAA